MDAQKFLADFGHLANAPKGVARLRDLVLELAVRGKLLSPSVKTSDAQTLLNDIQQFRSTLVQRGRLKRADPLPKIEESELTFELPEKWAFERLGNVCEIIRGVTFPSSRKQTTRSENSVACLRTSNVQSEIEWEDLIYIHPELVSRDDQWVEKGDTIISMANSYELVGKVALVKEVKERATFGGFIAAIRPHGLESEYLYLVLRSPYMQSRMRATSSQTTNIANISLGGMRPIPTPIPPKEDQPKIVAKVNELLALCDKLETQQQARRKLQNSLRQSILHAVVTATSSSERQATWLRLTNIFEWLFRESEDVEQFKGMVLDLALSGLLHRPELHQNSSGSELLNSISNERIKWSKHSDEQEQKEALGMLKKLRTQKVKQPDIKLPSHWCWGSILQISQAVVDCHNKTATYVSNGIHLVRTTDIRNGRMDLTKTRKVSSETYAFWARRMPPKPGDIFFTREAPMGEAAIVPDGEKVCLGQRTMLIRPFQEYVSNRFLLYTILSPSFQARMVKSAIGMTVKHLRVGDVEDLLLPVPPKFEQDRIVKVLDQLFKMCDAYSDHLERKKKVSSKLAIAFVNALTGIETKEEENSRVKAPQTELIAPLRSGSTPNIKAQAPLAAILAQHSGELGANDLWKRFGGEIDAFYGQLKIEVAHGWILEPTLAVVREVHSDTVST